MEPTTALVDVESGCCPLSRVEEVEVVSAELVCRLEALLLLPMVSPCLLMKKCFGSPPPVVVVLLIPSLDNDSALILEQQAPNDEESSIFTSSMTSSCCISPVVAIIINRDEDDEEDDDIDGSSSVLVSEVCMVFSLSLSDTEIPSSMLFPPVVHIMGSSLLLQTRDDAFDMEDMDDDDDVAEELEGTNTGEEHPERMLLPPLLLF